MMDQVPRHENAGHENDGPAKYRCLKMQDMKMKDQTAKHENAGHENEGPNCKA